MATADQARAAFNSVRAKFLDKVGGAIESGESFSDYSFDNIHHWNWHLGDHSLHALDPRNLFPVSKSLHKRIHTETTLGPIENPLDIHFKPIDPKFKLFLDRSYPRAPPLEP